MKVFDLEKQYEACCLLVLFIVNSMLFLLSMDSSGVFIDVLVNMLACVTSLLFLVLVLNSKSSITICRYGVHYRSLLGRLHCIEADKVEHIHQYSVLGLRFILIFGDKFICLAPFYSLTDKHHQRLKRYDNGLVDWLHAFKHPTDCSKWV